MPVQDLPRTTRACKSCRSLKVRCLPSDQGSICQKCVRSGAECVFEEQRLRRKREKPDSRARVAALERKLEEVIAQVSCNSNIAQIDCSVDKTANTPKKRDPEQTQRNRSSRAPAPADKPDYLLTPESQQRDRWTDYVSDTLDSHKVSQSTTSAVFSRYLQDGATPEALISRGHLSIGDVESFLENFHDMCSYFPFVIIPRGTKVNTMLQERPLLLHAALAVATSSEVHLQKVLEKSFKKIMLSKLMLQAEKSIDLLQSILICIAWGHFFHIPKRDQSYQLLQMAISLCVELGLNMTPSLASQKIGLDLSLHQPSKNANDDIFWSREAGRAYLGCYHLSTMNNWIWAKPNTLEYSEYILQCADSISKVPEYPTDELILPLIQLQQTGDEYHKVLRAGRSENRPEGFVDRIGAHARSLHLRMQELQDNLSPVAASSTAVRLAIHFVGVHTNEQDLLSPFLSIGRRIATGASLESVDHRTNCPSRIDILLDCLQAATEYLDLFLTIPLGSYSQLGTSQWSGLIYSLVVVYRLSIGTPRVPSWDIQVARDTVKLEIYLEVVCDRMQQVTRQRLRAITETNKRDLYSVMGLVLQNVRNTYEKLRRLPQEKSSTDDAPVHATSFPDLVVDTEPLLQPRAGPIFSQDQPEPSYQSRCPAMQFWSLPDVSGNSSTEHTGDDPFLNMNIIDDDGFWHQTFSMEQAQWDMDLNVTGT